MALSHASLDSPSSLSPQPPTSVGTQNNTAKARQVWGARHPLLLRPYLLPSSFSSLSSFSSSLSSLSPFSDLRLARHPLPQCPAITEHKAFFADRALRLHHHLLACSDSRARLYNSCTGNCKIFVLTGVTLDANCRTFMHPFRFGDIVSCRSLWWQWRKSAERADICDEPPSLKRS